MSDRPSVLHFTTTGAIAGAEQLLADLSEVHNRVRFQVSYATLFSPGEMNRKIQENGASCISLGVRSVIDVPCAAIRLATLLHSEQVDILHTHLLHAGFIGLIAAKLAGRKTLKLVHTRHHSDELHRFGPKLNAKVDQFVALKQDIVCSNSLAARAVLIDLEGVPESRIRLTYPGVNLCRIRAQVTDFTGQSVRKSLGLTAENLVVGSVAHLFPKKGHKHLLSAMTKIIKKLPQTRLLIIGRGPEHDALTSLIENLGLTNYVQLLGYREDVPDLINSFDLMIQPSLEEAFGLAMVEGMALGKPIIGSNIGGIPEVIDDGKTGVLVAPGDDGALASAIIQLLSHDDHRMQMGKAAAIRAEDRFSISRHAADYEAVWTEAIAL